MDEAERAGMECLTWAYLETVVDELSVTGCGRALQYLVASVSLVVEQCVTYVLHVGTYLVGTASLEYALDKCGVAKPLQRVIVGDGMLAYIAVRREHCHLHTVFWISAYVALDTAFVFSDMPPHERIVLALGGLVEELASEVSLGFGCLGNDEEPAGVLVDTVDKSDLRVVEVVLRLILQVPCQCIEQRAVPVAVTGMHDKSSLFVDDDDGIVLVYYVEWDFFGQYGIVVMRTVEHHAYYVKWLDLVTALDRTVVAEYETGIGCPLYAVSAYVRQVFDDEEIDTHEFLTAVGCDAVVLVKPRRVFVVEFFISIYVGIWQTVRYEYLFYFHNPPLELNVEVAFVYFKF